MHDADNRTVARVDIQVASAGSFNYWALTFDAVRLFTESPTSTGWGYVSSVRQRVYAPSRSGVCKQVTKVAVFRQNGSIVALMFGGWQRKQPRYMAPVVGEVLQPPSWQIII
jgi:hypothetical protein